jgi:hypothetical protein
MSLLPLVGWIISGLVLIWAAPASAFSITFIEADSNSSNISVTTDLPSPLVLPLQVESASLFSVIPGTIDSKALGPDNVILRNVELLDGTAVSDVATLFAQNGTINGSPVVGIHATFSSQDPAVNGGFIDLPEFDVTTLAETGSLQLLLSESIPLVGGGFLPISISALSPVPEPGTLALFGSSLVGLSAAIRRRHRRS